MQAHIRSGMSVPGTLLRLEAFALLLASILEYRHLSGAWWLFALLLLAPDLSMLGYLAGQRVGSAAYNSVHTLLTPAAVTAIVVAGHLAGRALPLLCIWFAHIGLDRLLGYGLKYPTAFRDTHLQRV